MIDALFRDHRDIVLLWCMFGPLIGLAIGATLASPSARWVRR